jgi:DUF1365 family protein
MSRDISNALGSLYVGTVTHRRNAPRVHRLKYRIFSVMLDLAGIDKVVARSRLFSRNHFNLYSFHDRDHGNGSDVPLRTQIDELLNTAGVDLRGGRVSLLCMPRVLGYAFNPLSVYYCYDADDTLSALVYEVSNTFRQRHTYVIPVAAQTPGAEKPRPVFDGNGLLKKSAPATPITQRCQKQFHVSPFIGMDMRYVFRVTRPEERMSVVIDVLQQTAEAGCALPSDTPLLSAAYAAQQRPFSDTGLLRLHFTHPLLTLKVIFGIHWEALQTWIKGARFRSCPPQGPALTIVRLDDERRTGGNQDEGEPRNSERRASRPSTYSSSQV